MAKTWLGRTKQRILRKFIRVGLSGFELLVKTIPRHAGVTLGGYLGWMAFYFLRRERQRALSHIQLALDDLYQPEQYRKIIKTSFQNLGKNLLEVLYLPRLTPAEIDQMVSIEGEDCLKKARSMGRGVIFVTGHIGSWEIGAASLARRYHPTVILAAPIYDLRLEEIMVGIRKIHQIETIVRGQNNAHRRLLSTLREGGVVVLAIDQDTRVDGVFVPFFGREAYTPAGAALLALRTGAAVVIGFSLRQRDGRHRVVIQGPLKLIETGDKKADIRTNTARFTEVIEQFIRDYPDQWIWMHDRWKTAKSN
jgi:Kdo2-lipid IVA lauroyltransferase/acyltransferase